MLQARQGKEVVVTAEDRLGLLFELSKMLSEKGLAILGMVGAVTDKECLIRFVTDDTLRALDVLTEAGYEPHEEEVILLEVPHKTGMLKRITEVLTKGHIDNLYIYGTAIDTQEKCLVVLHTNNDIHAIPRLNEMAAGLARL